MKKARLCLLFTLVLLLILPRDASAVALSLSAKSAVLIDGNGQILYQKNAFEKRPMASTTKIMTALVAIEHGDLSSVVEIPAAATGIEGSSIYLRPGEKMTLEELLYALLLASANDAATAIAIDVGGSLDGFVALMNQKAQNLGLTGTHFDNPHGLDSPEHYTTAYDLSLLTACALADPTFSRLCGTAVKTIGFGDPETTRHLSNHNRLLSAYSGAVGVKTGFTHHSGRCLVSAARRDGLLLIAVTLNDPNDWQDHARMLDFGFERYENLCLVDSVEDLCPLPVVGGEKDVCPIGVTDASLLFLTLPRDHKAVTLTVETSRFLYAPVSRGQCVGRAVWKIDGKEIASTALIAQESIGAKAQKSIWERIRAFFASLF